MDIQIGASKSHTARGVRGQHYALRMDWVMVVYGKIVVRNAGRLMSNPKKWIAISGATSMDIQSRAYKRHAAGGVMAQGSVLSMDWAMVVDIKIVVRNAGRQLASPKM